MQISRTQALVVLAAVVLLAGLLLLGRQFGWFAPRHEPVAIPSGTPYAEGTVIGTNESVVLANRVVRPDATRDESALPKLMEILVDGKTVFAKITSSGPVKISRAALSEGDIVWIYKQVRSLEETLAEPVPPELAVPLADALKNPRERIETNFVVKVGK